MGQGNECTTKCCTARSPCGPRQDEFADKVERGQKPDVYTTAGVLDKDPLLGQAQRHWDSFGGPAKASSVSPSPICEEALKWDPVSADSLTSCEELPEKRRDGANIEDCLEFQFFHPPLPPPMEAPPENSLQMPPAAEAPPTSSGGASLIDDEAQRRIDASATEVTKRTLRFNEDVERKSVHLTSLLPLKEGRSDEEQQLNDRREEGNPADDGKQVEEASSGMSSNASNRPGKKKVTSFWNPTSPGIEEEDTDKDPASSAEEQASQNKAEQVQRDDALKKFLSDNKFDSSDVNQPRKGSKWGCPIHLAVIQNRVEIVESLMEAKADPSQRDQKFRTAWQLAKMAGKQGEEVLAKLGVEEVPTQPEKKSMVRSLFNRMSHSKPGEAPVDNVSPARSPVPNRTNGHPVRSSMFSPVRGAESKPLPVS